MSDIPNAPQVQAPPDAGAIRAWLDYETTGLQSRRSEVLRAAHEVVEWLKTNPITDEETQARVTDLRRQAEAVIKVADEARLQKGKPFREGQATVNGYYQDLIRPLQDIVAPMRKAMDAFAIAEAARKQREADEAAAAARRKADEEAAAAAAALRDGDRVEVDDALARAETTEKIAAKAERAAAKPISERSRVRTGFGATSSLVETVSVEVEDPKKVPRSYLVPDLQTARQDVMEIWKTEDGKARIRRGETIIPGFRVTINASTRTRG